ncbi:unnamed protein product, partial [Candidula unifasciata]
DCGVERVMRDLRIFRIFEGTNDILRLFIALTGIQYAGSQLKELQKALSNPTANLGLLVGAGAKKAKRLVGISTGNVSLSKYVHPELASSGEKIAKLIDAFGGTVEDLLIKHNKKIIEEQFILKRLADAAIDIYGTVAVLSRVTRSLNNNYISAKHEKRLCEVWCSEAVERIRNNLLQATDSGAQKNFETLATISKEVVGHGGIFHRHVLGF